ncbi:MAG TPA: NYN domain-containing protein [Oscillatoriaceae cyanobacterium]
MPERLALFIDAAYLERALADIFAQREGGRAVPLRPDFKRLPGVLALDKPWRTYYYYALPYRSNPPLPAEQAAYEGRKRFVDFVGRQPRFLLREGVVERRVVRGEETYVQKRSDVMLAVDLTRLSVLHEITAAVLVAGDSDFVPAVQAARDAGVRVRLRYEGSTAHADLIAACDEAQPLTRHELEAIRLPG